MKVAKPVLLLLFLLTAFTVHAQDVETQELIRSIDGQWKLNESGNVVYTSVIEIPGASKEDLYYSAMYYLHQDYGNAGIQLQDLEAGKIQVKGIYPRVHIAGGRSNQYYFNALHEVRLEVKDEVLIMKVLLTGYFLTSYNHPYHAQAAEGEVDNASGQNSFGMKDFYPAGSHTTLYAIDKNDTGQAFYESHQKALATSYKLGSMLKATASAEAE